MRQYLGTYVYRILTIFGLACMAVPAHAGSSPEEIAYISCRACHAGQGSDAAIPAIAGRPAAELSDALSHIAQNPSDSVIMHRFTTGLTPTELTALAHYISGLDGDAR